MRQRELEVLLLRRPGLRIVRKRNQLGWAHQIESHVVLDGAQSGARHDHLEHQNENEDGGEESAGSRDGQRAENVVKQNFSAILHAAHTAPAVLRTLRLSGSNLDAQDRKSTRLNSSHSQISYAVFCLKKKKNY